MTAPPTPPPAEPGTTRSPKRTKPSFDVGRAAIDGQGTRWVYRSDAPPGTLARPRETRTPAAAPAVEPSAPVAATPDESARVAATPPSPAPTRPTVGWMEIGAGVLVMPLTLAVTAMVAPVLWIAGSRPRR